MSKSHVHFLSVFTNNDKLKKIGATLNDLFFQGKKVLVLMPNLQAASYLDSYLWGISAESFLPHTVANSPTDERIAITTLHENINDATVLFNLNPTISPISNAFETIYDLEDHTSPEKELASKERKRRYEASLS